MTDMTKLKLNLHADALAAVFIAKSREETRYYLNGVYVTPWKVGDTTGVMMVATDGRILATYFDREGEANRPAIIDGAFAGTLLKTGHGEKAPRRLVCEGEVGRVICVRKDGQEAAGLTLVREIDGKFPNWNKVVPARNECRGSAIFTWSHLILERVCRISQRTNGHQQPAMNVWQNSADDPAVFTFGTDSPLMVIAMPMRGDRSPLDSFGYAATSGEPIETAAQSDAALAAE